MDIEFTGTQPKYMTEGAGGADLEAAWGYEIESGKQVMVDTGTAIAIPTNFVGLLLPRSSLCNKIGLTLVNSVGVIDSDYRGVIKFCYKNTGRHKVTIKKGERIGQLVITPVAVANFIGVTKLKGTERGGSGFGSTGQ